MNSILPIVLLIMSFVLAGCSGMDHPADGPLDLTILHINDHHSHLDEERLTLRLTTAGGQRERVEVSAGGFARVSAAIKSLSQSSGQVVKIHAGDALTGDLYYTLTQGEADAALMNTVCFDTFTLGNHEFDAGDSSLKIFLDFLAQGPCSTKVLSANVRFGASSALSPAHAPGYVLHSTILERGGSRIGFIGLTIASKTQYASRPDAGTRFLDEMQSAQEEIDALTQQGVSKIILQSHVGYPMDRELAQGLRGVDVIVGGDSHSLLGPSSLAGIDLTPQGDYPTRLLDAQGKMVCVVQAGHYSLVVGELKVSFDKNGDVTACEGTPHILIGDDFTRGGVPLAEEDRAVVMDELSALKVLSITPRDPLAQDALRPYAQRKLEFGSEQVGFAQTHLCSRRVPGSLLGGGNSSLGDLCDKDPHVVAHGGDAQQLVADAFLSQGRRYFDADLSIQNGGGVRIDLLAGPLTVNDVYRLLSFKNTLMQLNATGGEIKAALEDALDNIVVNSSSGGYPYSSGLRWHVDMNQPKGSRFSAMEILGRDGLYRALDPTATYRVVLINFLADGLDHYTAFASIPADRRVDVGLDYAQAFLDYLADLPGSDKVVRRLPTASYSTQSFIELKR